MIFLLLNLLQPQQRGISRVVIVGAILAFIAGVSLLVYFYRRYRGSEKEPEEDWDMSRRSLFVTPPSQKIEESDASEATEDGASAAEELPVQKAGTRELASIIEPAAELPVTPAASEPRIETPPHHEPLAEPFYSVTNSVAQAPDPQPAVVNEIRPTEVLASPALREPVAIAPDEHDVAPFDDEVWAGLEAIDEPPLISTTAPPGTARVDERSHRAAFEPPRIERIEHREPYEPPHIQPLTPREQAAATRELRSPRPTQPEQTPENTGQSRSMRETGVFGSSALASGAEPPVRPQHIETGTSEMAADASLWNAKGVPEPSIAGGYARKAAAGSILGLPAETSNQPMVYGDPARSAGESGIDALSNYGKDVGPKGGRGGTIALLLVLVVLGGGLLLYLFVPSIHARVTAYVAHLRGTDTQAALEASLKQRAQIIPSFRPEVNKNMVTARGAIDNISDEPLENLSIEVSLQRGGDAPAEIRNVSVVPNPLPPGQRGSFEFEYDGKRDTGFTGYKITRLFSNGAEVRFRMPGQK